MDLDFTLETITPDSSTLLTVGGGGALQLPSGIQTSRPVSASAGSLRWNTTAPQLEFYDGTVWNSLSPNNLVTSITGTANQITASSATGAVTLSISSNPVIPGTGSLTIPNGTTVQRPASPTSGMERWNTTLGYAELYNGSVWQPLGRILQLVTAAIPATTGTTTIATALTAAPTTSDGFQIWTTSFTPISSSSKLLIQFNAIISSNTLTRIVVASCFAGTTNIGSSAASTSATNVPYPMPYQTIYSPGSTSTITISCRIGPTSAATIAVNQWNGTTDTLGGAAVTNYTIMEIL